MARTPAGRLGRHPSRVRAGRVARTAAAPLSEKVDKVAQVPDLPPPTIEEVRAWAADEIDKVQVQLGFEKDLNRGLQDRIRELEAGLDLLRQEGKQSASVLRGMRKLASLRWLPNGLTPENLENLREAVTSATSIDIKQEMLLAAGDLVQWLAEELIQGAFPRSRSNGPEPT